ncbi:hypothetical protein M501DRAFT_965285 [Patellaria atrata CBS 101060]|uniref:SAM and PH domain-containing protein n=1 Tax=Patellaria atrata CBS 101060 TaxID=1346257 RepID=A0A9P4SJ12_9PEZI|nr:hypothetical protein M501DRAFT_965285 [Patellaria atrata CBS 101060]
MHLQQAMTPITPLEPGVEMFQRKLQPFLAARTSTSRPLSEATEIFDTDFEDSDPDMLVGRMKSSFIQRESRKSQTTISTYDEVSTPHSNRKNEWDSYMPEMKAVEGPRGPHLFRASQASSDFNFDYALQMSPLLPKDTPLRTDTGFQSIDTVTGRRPLTALSAAVAQLDSLEVRNWSAQQVAAWMAQAGFEESIVYKFELHEINGEVLLDLQFEDLKELDIQSFGKRHQLWNEIDALRGNEGRTSPIYTPFQDISRPCTRNTRSNSRANSRARDRDRSASRARYGGDECDDDGFDAMTPGGGNRRGRGRKPRNARNDPITPAESVSIVAIEQLLPKPHKCAKGERCAKWRKQKRQLQKLHEEHGMENGFPISPEKGGHIFVAGNPGNAATAEKCVENVYRPVSTAIPSVVASSDVLGPGQLPEFILQEDMLRNLEQRDPQENVKQFLSLQHMDPPSMPLPIQEPIDSPPTPPMELFPPLQPPTTQAPHSNLKSLPKLNIPRSASANPYGIQSARGLDTGVTPCRSATASPSQVYRFGTPCSEMDVPVTAILPGPIARDASQSVPPNMQYRDPIARSASRTNDWRRPSFALPQLNENEVFSPSDSHSSSSTIDGESRPSTSADSVAQLKKAGGSAPRGFQYPGAAHTGWMKKRKTKLLRHEWHDQHFRLTGTQLAMHQNELPSSQALNTIDVDDYAVACSTLASNKLSAKFKALGISSGSKKQEGAQDAAFAFQLVPAVHPSHEGEHKMLRKSAATGKTHHFAVKTRDERIDWMRELMLAKALRAKGEGFDVVINGQDV